MGFGSYFHDIAEVGRQAIVGTADSITGSLQQHLVGTLDDVSQGIMDSVVDPVINTSFGIVDDANRQFSAIMTRQPSQNYVMVLLKGNHRQHHNELAQKLENLFILNLY